MPQRMTPEEQAARIAELETRVDLLQNELFEVRKGKDAQEVISELMARIAEEERAAMLACAEDLHGIDEGHLIEARRQLAEEHPEAFRP